MKTAHPRIMHLSNVIYACVYIYTWCKVKLGDTHNNQLNREFSVARIQLIWLVILVLFLLQWNAIIALFTLRSCTPLLLVIRMFCQRYIHLQRHECNRRVLHPRWYVNSCIYFRIDMGSLSCSYLRLINH